MQVQVSPSLTSRAPRPPLGAALRGAARVDDAAPRHRPPSLRRHPRAPRAAAAGRDGGAGARAAAAGAGAGPGGGDGGERRPGAALGAAAAARPAALAAGQRRGAGGGRGAAEPG